MPIPAGAAGRSLAQSCERRRSGHPGDRGRQPGLHGAGGPGLGKAQRKAPSRWSGLVITRTRPRSKRVALPLAHYLESWGDARTPDGTLVPVQPLIEPLFGGLTEIEVLARVGGMGVNRPLRSGAADLSPLRWTDEERWKRFLHDGFLAGSAPAGPVGFRLGGECQRGGAAQPAMPPSGPDRA
jgi:hypothetical protein